MFTLDTLGEMQDLLTVHQNRFMFEQDEEKHFMRIFLELFNESIAHQATVAEKTGVFHCKRVQPQKTIRLLKSHS